MGAVRGAESNSSVRAEHKRVTRSVSADTWLDSEARTVEEDAAAVRRLSISPVTWASADDKPVFSLVSWSEWARTTDFKAGIPGSTPAPVGCLGCLGFMRKRGEKNLGILL